MKNCDNNNQQHAQNMVLSYSCSVSIYYCTNSWSKKKAAAAAAAAAKAAETDNDNDNEELIRNTFVSTGVASAALAALIDDWGRWRKQDLSDGLS